MSEVTFVVLASNTKVTKWFASEYQARRFVNKLKHSKRCRLISCPLFRW